MRRIFLTRSIRSRSMYARHTFVGVINCNLLLLLLHSFASFIPFVNFFRAGANCIKERRSEIKKSLSAYNELFIHRTLAYSFFFKKMRFSCRLVFLPIHGWILHTSYVRVVTCMRGGFKGSQSS